MRTILDSAQMEESLGRIAEAIAADIPSGAPLGVIGIRSRGEIIAQRISGLLARRIDGPVPCGALDITLYRDDLNSPQGESQPEVRTTEIGFGIDGRVIVLIDDVLYTGRSARAAMDALMDLGRPRAVRLAVLVERPGRELPVQADYAGLRVRAETSEKVRVNLVESDGVDRVVVE